MPRAERVPDQAIADRLRERFAPVAEVEPLAPDASVRRFYRLRRPHGATVVALVDQDGGPPALTRMILAADLLASIDVPVPRVLDRDESIPALLLEDLGDRLLAAALPELPPEDSRRAWQEAGRIAARIARRGSPLVPPDHPLAQPVLGYDKLRAELAFFAVHDVTARRGIDDRGLLAELAHVLDRVADRCALPARQLAHRDFHARNLLLRDDGSLGVVDFQDLLFAPPGYDLASLVHDPYVDLPPELADAAGEGWRAEAGGVLPDPRELEAWPWVSLQRLLKAIGTYAFQATRMDRPRFARYIPVAERRALAAARALPDRDRHGVLAILEKIGFEG